VYITASTGDGIDSNGNISMTAGGTLMKAVSVSSVVAAVSF